MNYKLIDCGSYVWFVKTDRKYHHCIYSVTGEYKKIRRSANPLMPSNQKMRLAYLMGWNLETAPCILNKKNAKFYLKLWKQITKTLRIKEIMKQLKEVS
jgi:hypothetical protein|tara:strand:- start:705 stop:1001 length:297 start_codon:yes stop_codon:yes gene_type:complete